MLAAAPLGEVRSDWTLGRIGTVAAVVLVVVAGWWWYAGGDRISDAVDAPLPGAIRPGETLWIGHLLSSEGPVEIRSVVIRPVHHEGLRELELDTVLIRLPADTGIPRTTNDLSAFVVEPVEGAVVDGSDRDNRPMVMVGVTADDVGAWRTNGIEVTYRSGIHPPRTAVLDLPACYLVIEDPGEHVDGEVMPAGFDPSAWTLFTSCGGP